MQTQRNKELQRTHWAGRLNSHCCVVVLLYGEAVAKIGKFCPKKQKCRHIHTHTDACKLHTAHTHTHSYSSVLHPNVPWGTLVLPLSSIWETIPSPGERRGMGRYVLLSSVTEKKTWYKSDKDTRQHHRLFSHKYLRPWHYIPSHIMLIDRHIFFSEIHNNRTIVSFNHGKLHSRDGKDADSAGTDSRITWLQGVA